MKKKLNLSRYTKIFSCQEDKNSLILFSTKNTATIRVPSSLIDDLKKGSLSEEERACLAEQGFLTDGLEREKQEMQGYINELNAVSTALRYILVLNLDCNLACTYCFEGKRKGKLYFSAENAKRFVDFVKQNYLTGNKDITVTFYGGEPLLSIDLIESISLSLLAFAVAQGVIYQFSLVTNGTLLTKATVKRLIPLGLRSVKITLDGPAEIHDRFRPFKSGSGSFDVITRNLIDVCDLVRVQIGGNYTRENYRAFPSLLDYLVKKGLTASKIPAVKFDPVINENEQFGPSDFHDGCESINEPWVSEAAPYLRNEILKRGYRTNRIMPTPCPLELRDSVMVNYDGKLYKCPGLIGRENCCVGDLVSGVRDYRESHGLDAWKNDECLECSYLPLCFGGCKYMQLLKTGTMQGVTCQKEYFERSLGELVEQDIKYNL